MPGFTGFASRGTAGLNSCSKQLGAVAQVTLRRAQKKRGFQNVKLRKSLWALMVVALTAATGNLVSGVAHAQQEGASASSGQYKLAVVDRKKVFDGYTKKNAEWDQLEKEKKAVEDDLNKRIDAATRRREAYLKERPNLPEEQRIARENELNREITDINLDGQNKQRDISAKGERIIRKYTSEINAAIQAIGQNENYHLIFESDTAISSVVFYTTTIDITQKVLDYVNSHDMSKVVAPAAPPASTSQPSSGQGTNRRR